MTDARLPNTNLWKKKKRKNRTHKRRGAPSIHKKEKGKEKDAADTNVFIHTF